MKACGGPNILFADFPAANAPDPDASVTVTVTDLASVAIFYTAHDLSNNELFLLKLKYNNDHNDIIAPDISPLKVKLYKNNFKDCMKLSRPISPIPSSLIK